MLIIRQFRWLCVFICLYTFQINVYAQHSDEASAVKWLSFDQAMELHKKTKKPLLIDVYTDWCGWCKHMMKTTFSDPGIAAYINQNYYPIRFDAEGNDTIRFGGKVYTNTPPVGNRKGTHQLAFELIGNRISYPTIVYYDADLKTKNPVPGYMSVKDIEPLLVYFAEEINKHVDFKLYKNDFDHCFAPDSAYKAKTKGEVKWLDAEKSLVQQKEKPKKLFFFFDAPWRNSSRLLKTVFEDKTLADTLNQYFYSVQFDVLSRDTFQLFGAIFINANPHPSIHGFPMAIMENQATFPALVFLDEQNKLIDRIPFYSSTEHLALVVEFIGSDIYKKQTWNDFLKLKKKY